MNSDYPSFCQEVKERYEKLLNPKTFWIHFDNDADIIHYKIPTIENLGYILALLNCHDKESVNNAFDRLKKILCFYVHDIGLPEFLHDYPEVKSFSEQFFIYIILNKINDLYHKFMKEDLKYRLDEVLSNLDRIFSLLITNKIVKEKYSAFKLKNHVIDGFSLKDFGDYLFIKGPKEDSFLNFDLWTLTVLNPWGIQKKVGVCEEMTSFHLLALFCLKRLNIVKVPNSLIRYLPILESKWQHLQYKENNNCVANVQIDNGMQINFPNDYSISFFSIYPLLIQKTKNGYDITINYPDEPLDEKETLIETKIFCSIGKDFNLLIDNKKVTTFSLSDEVIIVDSKNQQLAKVSFEAFNGVFLGTVGFGNRPLQKIKTFKPYDQIIGIRTVSRKENATLKLSFEYNENWNSNF